MISYCVRIGNGNVHWAGPIASTALDASLIIAFDLEDAKEIC